MADVVNLSKALYGRFVDKETLDYVDTWDDPDQTYFWTLLYYRMRDSLENAWLGDLQKEVAKRVSVSDDLAPLPFNLAEESVSTHSWFRRGIK